MHSDTHPVLQQFTEICEKNWSQTHESLVTARAPKHLLSFRHMNKIPLVQRQLTMLNARLHGFLDGVSTSFFFWLLTLKPTWQCGRVITALPRDTSTAQWYSMVQNSFKKMFRTLLNLKDGFTYLNSKDTLKAIITHLQNLTFRFLTVLLRFIFTFCIVTTTLNKVLGKLQLLWVNCPWR